MPRRSLLTPPPEEPPTACQVLEHGRVTLELVKCAVQDHVDRYDSAIDEEDVPRSFPFPMPHRHCWNLPGDPEALRVGNFPEITVVTPPSPEAV